MTVGIYIRVSTEEQAREGFSISAQKEKLKAYCQVQDWSDIKFYVDEGISAKDTNRPQLQLLLEHIKNGMIDTVLVYRLDRLTRSVMDLYKLLEVFEEYNCTFKSATEVYDTGSAMGRLFITLVAAMAQWERENLGERVRMGQIEKARQGKFSAFAPFGYDKTPDDKLIINEDEKQILLDMIEKVKEGYSMRQLADYMNNMGISPIRGYQWHISSILSMLKNPALYGAIRWRDEVIEGAHEGILTKEEFEHVGELLKSRQLKKKRKVNSFFVYQMKLICPKCGNHLTSERSKYERVDGSLYQANFYRCQPCALNKRKAISVSEKRLEEAFINYMESYTFKYEPEEKEEDNQESKLTQQMYRVQKQREKYQKGWANDLITDEEFAERMNETDKLLEDIQEKLKALNKPQKEEIDPEKLQEIINNFKQNWSFLTPKEKHQFLNMFIKAIHFDKIGRQVTVVNVDFH